MDKRHLLWSLGKYALGVGVLTWVIWAYWSPSGEGTEPGLREMLARPVQVGPVVAAGVFCAAAMLLMFVRWYVLVRSLGLPFTLRDAIRLGLLGMFFNTFLAGELGGDVVKAIGLAREQSRRSAAVASVLMDRGVGLWGLFWLAGVLGSLFWLGGNPALEGQTGLQGIILTAAGVLAVSVTLWALLTVVPEQSGMRLASWLRNLPKIGDAAAELWSALWTYRGRSGTVALAVLLAVGSHVCYVLTFFFAVQMFQEAGQSVAMPTLTEHFLLIPVGELIQAFFPAPGGAGGAEFGYGKLYGLVGQPEANGVLAALAYRVIVWGLSLAGYFLSSAIKSRVPE